MAPVTKERQFKELLDDMFAGRATRRDVMKQASALGLSAGVASTLIAGSASTARAQDASPVPVAGGTLRMAMQSDPSALDPQTLSLTAIWHVVEHIYDTLTRIQPDLTVSPSLAESWDI